MESYLLPKLRYNKKCYIFLDRIQSIKWHGKYSYEPILNPGINQFPRRNFNISDHHNLSGAYKIPVYCKLLVGRFLCLMVTASLAGFFGVSILFWYANAIYIHAAMVVIALPLLIQFAYNFPVINPQRKRQSKVVLIISIVFIILTIISTLIKILNPAFITLPENSSLILSIIQLFGILFTLFIFFDLSKQISNSSDTRNWFKQLLNPDNRILFAVRGFIFVLIIPHSYLDNRTDFKRSEL